MNSPSKRALYIGSVWPEPRSSAAGWRTLSILQALQSDDWAISFASTAAATPHRQSLQDWGIDERQIAVNDPAFDAYVHDVQPDLVVFDRFMVEEQFGWRVAEQCPHALRVLDTQDLHCLRDARQQALKQGKPMPTTTIHSDKAFREMASVLRCDLSLIISEVEMGWLTTHFAVPQERLYHLPFLLGPLNDEQVVAWPCFDERTDYVSIGNFRHAPNEDAVQHLKSTLWPLIRQRHPDAQLRVYGAYPPKSATQLHAPDDGFHLMGWAEDAKTVLRRARINLAPLRFGAGLKGKLAEAMLCGTPSVTTRMGAEGMQGTLPWPGSIADTPEALADAAVQLYHDADQWKACQLRGQAIINRLFAKPTLQAAFIQALNARLAHLAEGRRRNFTGAMLQHHALQSSRYLSKWIEAKNKA